MGHHGNDVKAANSKFWDQTAPRWRALGLPSAEKAQDLAARLGCSPGSAILDAGCGAGRWSVALARQGYRVNGLDLSPGMIGEARELAKEYGLGEDRVWFHVGDVESIPFPQCSFDAIVCHTVLDFAPSPGQALAELQRVTRPGGRLVLDMLGAYSPVKRESWQEFLPGSDVSDVCNHILPWEMEALLAAVGWEILVQEAFFGPSVSGHENAYTREMSDRLGDRVLQQTIATSWQFVARKPTRTSARLDCLLDGSHE